MIMCVSVLGGDNVSLKMTKTLFSIYVTKRFKKKGFWLCICSYLLLHAFFGHQICLSAFHHPQWYLCIYQALVSVQHIKQKTF